MSLKGTILLCGQKTTRDNGDGRVFVSQTVEGCMLGKRASAVPYSPRGWPVGLNVPLEQSSLLLIVVVLPFASESHVNEA